MFFPPSLATRGLLCYLISSCIIRSTRLAGHATNAGSKARLTGRNITLDARPKAIVDAFRFAWAGYQQFAFPNDDLRPVTNDYANTRNGWGVGAVDALSTAIIMEQEDIVGTILDFIPTINFTASNVDSPLSLFETNVRYIGGLIGAFDLLVGPFAHMNIKESRVSPLLEQAKVLADGLKFCFATPTGIPVNWVYIDNQTLSDINRNNDGSYRTTFESVGTLILEWQRLSDLTGDDSYATLARQAESWLFSPTTMSSEPFAGIFSGEINTDTGITEGQDGGWGTGMGSAYDYLLKMWIYDPARYEEYGPRFVQAADSTIMHLASSPETRPDLIFLSEFSGQKLLNHSRPNTCAAAGTFLLASDTLLRQDYADFGLRLAEWCANGYRQMATGIGPQSYTWNTTVLEDRLNRSQRTLFKKSGFFLDNRQAGVSVNAQTPDAIESWYYAYRVTSKDYWKDVGWHYFLAFNSTARVGSGFANLNHVNLPNGNGTQNLMYSFLFAKTFKFMYLLQSSNTQTWDVLQSGKDLFVYNMEGHPIRTIF